MTRGTGYFRAIIKFGAETRLAESRVGSASPRRPLRKAARNARVAGEGGSEEK